MGKNKRNLARSLAREIRLLMNARDDAAAEGLEKLEEAAELSRRIESKKGERGRRKEDTLKKQNGNRGYRRLPLSFFFEGPGKEEIPSASQ